MEGPCRPLIFHASGYASALHLFYGIANNWFGNSSLVSISESGGGAFTTLGVLRQGFNSGLPVRGSED